MWIHTAADFESIAFLQSQSIFQQAAQKKNPSNADGQKFPLLFIKNKHIISLNPAESFEESGERLQTPG